MAVTLTQLVAFLTVVRRGSVTAAAEELVVTQPSVSAAVNALERELGVRLTERAGRTVRPTAAGATYAPYAADVLGLLEQGGRAAREAAEAHPHTLRISAVTTAGEYLVPQLHPGVSRAPAGGGDLARRGEPRAGLPAGAGSQGRRGGDRTDPGRRPPRAGWTSRTTSSC